MKEVLNIPVTSALIRAWEGHFAPAVQPFYLSEDWVPRLPELALWRREELQPTHLPLSVRDTLNLHDVDPAATWVALLDEDTFGDLPFDTRCQLLEAQLAFRRGGVQVRKETGELYAWWPGVWHALTPEARWKRLKAFLETDRLACLRTELPSDRRAALRARFPAMEPLLGTYAAESGANCFTSVMAACGVPGVTDIWMHAPPFLRWLERAAVLSGTLDAEGTVLVWRDAAGVTQHAALALGEGWLFHKEAQAWFAPRQVVRLQDALERWQHEGWTVSGYALV